MDSLHHVPRLSPLSALKRPELEALLVEQSGEIVELKQTVADLREENARLKGLKGRPNIKPSGMDKGTAPAKPANHIDKDGRFLTARPHEEAVSPSRVSRLPRDNQYENPRQSG